MNIYEQSKLIDISASVEHRSMTWGEKLALVGADFLEQTQIECPVTHTFELGNYIRTMRIPMGTLFIGRPHKKGHVCRLDAGSIIQFTESGRIERYPGESIRSVPGYQVVLYALTDVIGSTIHPDSGERDLDKLEAEIFEPKQDFIELGIRVRKALEART